MVLHLKKVIEEGIFDSIKNFIAKTTIKLKYGLELVDVQRDSTSRTLKINSGTKQYEILISASAGDSVGAGIIVTRTNPDDVSIYRNMVIDKKKLGTELGKALDTIKKDSSK